MRATGWCSGGGVYGVGVSKTDRDAHFERHWRSVTLRLPDGEARVDITPSFWRCCTELRSSEIRDWLLAKGLAPWPKRKPPVFELVPDGDASFRIVTPRTEG